MLPLAFRRAGRPAVLGHRGSPIERAENTLESFELARAQGADGVELDVMRCQSGEVVVIHDPRLERLAGRPLEVAHTPWSVLREVDVGTPLGFPSARVPLLTEVLRAFADDFLINVELKTESRFPDMGLALATARLLQAAPCPERFVVSSFHPLLLSAFQRCAPGLATGFLFDPDLGRLARRAWSALLRPAALHPERSLARREAVARWRSRRYATCVWTVDDGELAVELARAGVDVLISNKAGAIRAAVSA